MHLKFVGCAVLMLIIQIAASAQSFNPHYKTSHHITPIIQSSLQYEVTMDESEGEDEHASEHVVDIENAWKMWQTVENFTYGKDRGALRMITDLKALHPFFRDKIYQLVKVCAAQGIELAVVESFRTHAKQSEYFGMGRKYTRSAGGKSKHQYGLAVDVVPVINGVAQWDNTALWKKVGVAGEKLGLRWGGRWRSPYDPAHFEWSAGMTGVELANGLLPALPKPIAQSYPCIEDDLKLLKKYWESWENEQALTARKQKNTAAGEIMSSN